MATNSSKQTITSIKLFLGCLALNCIASTQLSAKTIWHWEDGFSNSDKAMLTQWISQTLDAIEGLVGPYPFDVNIYFNQINNSHESVSLTGPTPWAHTQRGRKQGVKFYVDTRYPIEDFLNDWTAPHELSHLIIPYLGKNNAWFAEGFASFMQYQVMQSMGVISQEQAMAMMQKRVKKAENDYSEKGVSFISAAPRLVQKKKFPVMYWGGAVYFLSIDQVLKKDDSRLTDTLKHYLACCRFKAINLPTLIDQLDNASNSQLFSNQYVQFSTTRGFPNYNHLWSDD